MGVGFAVVSLGGLVGALFLCVPLTLFSNSKYDSGPPINGALLTAHFTWWRPALFSGVRAFLCVYCSVLGLSCFRLFIFLPPSVFFLQFFPSFLFRLVLMGRSEYADFGLHRICLLRGVACCVPAEEAGCRSCGGEVAPEERWEGGRNRVGVGFGCMDARIMDVR
jgi:hypothetical protein